MSFFFFAPINQFLVPTVALDSGKQIIVQPGPLTDEAGNILTDENGNPITAG